MSLHSKPRTRGATKLALVLLPLLIAAGCITSPAVPPASSTIPAAGTAVPPERSRQQLQAQRATAVAAPTTAGLPASAVPACAAPALVALAVAAVDPAVGQAFAQACGEITRLASARDQWRDEVRQAKRTTMTLRAPAPGFGCLNPALGALVTTPGRDREDSLWADPDCIPGYGRGAVATGAPQADLARRVTQLKRTDATLMAEERAASAALVSSSEGLVRSLASLGAGNWTLDRLATMSQLVPSVIEPCLARLSHRDSSLPSRLAALQTSVETASGVALGQLAPRVAASIEASASRAELARLMGELFPTPWLRQVADRQPGIEQAVQSAARRHAAAEQMAETERLRIPDPPPRRPGPPKETGRDGKDLLWPCFDEYNAATTQLARSDGLDRSNLLRNPYIREAYFIQDELRKQRNPADSTGSWHALALRVIEWIDASVNPGPLQIDLENCFVAATSPYESTGMLEAHAIARQLGRLTTQRDLAATRPLVARLEALADRGNTYGAVLLATHLLRNPVGPEGARAATSARGRLLAAASEWRSVDESRLPKLRGQPIRQVGVYEPLFSLLTGQVPGAKDLAVARQVFDDHHDLIAPAHRQKLIPLIPGAAQIAQRYAQAAAEAEERRKRAELERLTIKVKRDDWDRCFRNHFDRSYSGWPVDPRIGARGGFIVNQTCGPMPPGTP